MWMFIIFYTFFAVLTTTQTQSTGCIDANAMCTSTLKSDPNACSDGLFRTFCCKSCTPTTTSTTTTTTTTPPPTPAPKINSRIGSSATDCPERTSRISVCLLGPQICSNELFKTLCCITCAAKLTTTPSTTQTTTTTTSRPLQASSSTKCRKRNAPALCSRITLSDQNLCSDQLLGSVCCDSQSCARTGLESSVTTSSVTTSSMASTPKTTTTASIARISTNTRTTTTTTTIAPNSRGILSERNMCLKRGKKLSRRCKIFRRAGLDICRLAPFCCEPCKGKEKDATCVDQDKKACKGIKAPDCYEAAIKRHCCAKCKKFEKNIEGCMYGDRASNCKSLETILGLNSMCQTRSLRCCETCQKLSDPVRGPSGNRHGGPGDRTRITRIFQTRPGGQGGSIFQRRISGSMRDLFSALAG